MSPDQLGTFVGLLQIGLLVKLFFFVLGLFYFVFVVVIYRQITLMNQVLNSKVSPLIQTIALSQIFAAAGLFILIILFA